MKRKQRLEAEFDPERATHALTVRPRPQCGKHYYIMLHLGSDRTTDNADALLALMGWRRRGKWRGSTYTPGSVLYATFYPANTGAHRMAPAAGASTVPPLVGRSGSETEP